MFNQKMFTNGLNMGLPIRSLFEKIMEGKQIDSPVKKKFRTQYSLKKFMLTIFDDMKRHISIDLLEKCATVNSASSY